MKFHLYEIIKIREGMFKGSIVKIIDIIEDDTFPYKIEFINTIKYGKSCETYNGKRNPCLLFRKKDGFAVKSLDNCHNRNGANS